MGGDTYEVVGPCDEPASPPDLPYWTFPRVQHGLLVTEPPLLAQDERPREPPAHEGSRAAFHEIGLKCNGSHGPLHVECIRLGCR